MKLHELSPAEGSVKRHGVKAEDPVPETEKRPEKQQGTNARSGGGVRPGFEGGQIPLYRKLPKRGFNNRFAKEYAIVNLDALNSFNDGDTVNLEALMSCGKIKKALDGLKILGNGEITKKITVQAKVFSKSAKEKIEAAGGKAEVI